MKSSVSTHVCWAFVAFIAFAVGFFTADIPKKQISLDHLSAVGKGDEHSSSSVERVAVGASSLTAEAIPVVEPLTGADACGRVLEVLSNPSRTARMQLMGNVLGQITSENWLQVVDAWINLLCTRGPLPEAEWDLLLERVGEVAGADAMKNAWERKKTEALPGIADALSKSVLKGWAAGNPKDAVAWYRAQPEDVRQVFSQELMTGLARSTPKEALMIAVEQPVSSWPDKIRLILENANQSAGLSGGEEVLQAANAPVPELFKAVLFEQIAAKAYGQLAVRNRPSEALAWIEPYAGQSFVSSKELARFVSMATIHNGLETLTWLDQRAERLTPAQTDAAYNALGKGWNEWNSKQFLEWLKSNGNHPRLATITASLPAGSPAQ